jgi:hypothetical protein
MEGRPAGKRRNRGKTPPGLVFILRLQSGNEREMAHCDSGLSLGVVDFHRCGLHTAPVDLPEIGWRADGGSGAPEAVDEP